MKTRKLFTALSISLVLAGNLTAQQIVNGVEITNSYDKIEELKKTFPVIYPTPIKTQMARNIENRLLTGFDNWNRGFDAWKAWGTILYTEDSIYNVHGVRFTLAEYQAAMNVTLQKANILMGDFQNIIVCDDWAAIRYATATRAPDGTEIPGGVMEFVKFKDYGADLGTRVEEGWGGTRSIGPNSSFTGMSYFQTQEERDAQKKIDQEQIAYIIPNEKNLAKKYPVKFPTKDDSKLAKQIRKAILKDFDSWNNGFDAWAENADAFYTKDAVINYKYSTAVDVKGYKQAQKELNENQTISKLYFDSMMISEDWCAIHFRTVYTDTATGEKTPGDIMQFYHFVKDGKNVKCDMMWSSGR